MVSGFDLMLPCAVRARTQRGQNPVRTQHVQTRDRVSKGAAVGLNQIGGEVVQNGLLLRKGRRRCMDEREKRKWIERRIFCPSSDQMLTVTKLMTTISIKTTILLTHLSIRCHI